VFGHYLWASKVGVGTGYVAAIGFTVSATTIMSLLQGVLRNQTLLDAVDKKFEQTHIGADDSDEELINVVSIPGTPAYSRPASRSGSPAFGKSSGLSRVVKTKSRTDPLRAFPTELTQRLFSLLGIKDLANCSRVSKKWNTSQSINYVWFRHYRKENFNDISLPPGKWTKKESKQNWRVMYMQSIPNREQAAMGSGYSTSGSRSGYQTPKELKEQQWQSELEPAAKPTKNELREMYKELGGRKSRGKGKVGGTGLIKDRTAFGDDDF